MHISEIILVLLIFGDLMMEYDINSDKCNLPHIPSKKHQKLIIQGWPLKYAFQLILVESVAVYFHVGI